MHEKAIFSPIRGGGVRQVRPMLDPPLGQRLQHWPNIRPALAKCTICLRESPPAQQTQNISITFIQRRPNVFDVCPALYEVIQMLCLLGVSRPTILWSARFEIGLPAVIQSDCLQTKANLRARAKGFELWWNY